MKKLFIATACVNFITALIHTIAGHYDLILPFIQLEFNDSLKAILHACWHMVTVILFFSSFVLFYIGLRPNQLGTKSMANLIGVLYIAFALVFIFIAFSYHIFLSQALLLLPIGVMSVIGAKGIRYDVAG